MKNSKKVLWFSRHEMTPEQRAALGDVEIIQVNKSINSAYCEKGRFHYLIALHRNF